MEFNSMMYMGGFGGQQHGEFIPNRAPGSFLDMHGSHPVSTAWLIHQSTGGDDASPMQGEEEYHTEELPLQAACGYLDDMLFGSFAPEPMSPFTRMTTHNPPSLQQASSQHGGQSGNFPNVPVPHSQFQQVLHRGGMQPHQGQLQHPFPHIQTAQGMQVNPAHFYNSPHNAFQQHQTPSQPPQASAGVWPFTSVNDQSQPPPLHHQDAFASSRMNPSSADVSNTMTSHNSGLPSFANTFQPSTGVSMKTSSMIGSQVGHGGNSTSFQAQNMQSDPNRPHYPPVSQHHHSQAHPPTQWPHVQQPDQSHQHLPHLQQQQAPSQSQPQQSNPSQDTSGSLESSESSNKALASPQPAVSEPSPRTGEQHNAHLGVEGEATVSSTNASHDTQANKRQRLTPVPTATFDGDYNNLLTFVNESLR